MVPAEAERIHFSRRVCASTEGEDCVLPDTASHPAVTRANNLTKAKRDDCIATVKALFIIMRLGIRSRDIMTLKVCRKRRFLMARSCLSFSRICPPKSQCKRARGALPSRSPRINRLDTITLLVYLL